MRTKTPKNQVLFKQVPRMGILGLFVVSVVLISLALFHPTPASAATSSTLNFQARLETAGGAIVPDGNYNVEFKLYSASSGGIAEWTEDYTYNSGPSATDIRLRVVNGYLTVNLGSITAFPNTIDWTQQQWLTMNIGGTSNSSVTWDGEMSPRVQLTAVPYALEAGALATTSGSNVATLKFGAVTASDAITLPDASGTVCLQSSSSCGFATGSGTAFLQGGNGFSGTTAGELGTNNNGVLNFRTNNADKLQLDTSGNLIFQQASTFNVASAATGTQLTIQGGAATSGTNVGGTLLLQGGAGATTGASGSVIVKANTNNSSTAFQVQNAAGAALLTSDTSNMRVVVSQGNLDVTGVGVAPTGLTVSAGSNQGGSLSGASGSTYYYQVSAVMSGGETIPSSEVSINGSSFTPLTPPGAPTLALAAGTALGVGVYRYEVTFVTANGETLGGTEASITTTTGNQAVNLSAIPTGPTGTTSRNIYRTQVGNPSGWELFVATIANNTTTTYSDTATDASITNNNGLPSSNTATTNTNNASLTWTAVSGASSYRVYRGTSSGGENVYFTSATNSYTDTGSAGTSGSEVSTDTTQRLGVGTLSPRVSLDVLGSAIIQTPVNSTSALQVKNAGGTSTLNVDTTNGTLTVRSGTSALTYGSNLYSGSFSSGWTTTGWTIGGGGTTATHNTGNTVLLTNNSVAITAGEAYEVDFTINISCSSLKPDGVNVTVGAANIGAVSGYECGSVNRTFTGTATNTNGLTFNPGVNFAGTISNIQIIPLTGAYKSTLTLQDTAGNVVETRIGGGNLFLGYGSGQIDTGSFYNNAIGLEALQNNDTGYSNSVLGTFALQLNSSGYRNVAIGQSALQNNSAGINNVAIGYQSLYNNTAGNNNSALGYYAGYQDSGGNFVTSAALQNATAIGTYAQVQASNSIVIGSVDTATKVGIGTTIPDNTFSVEPVFIDDNTNNASQSGSTITGVSTTWVSSSVQVGMRFIFASGVDAGTITAVNSNTSLTVSTSQTVSSQHYRIHRVGFQVTSSGNAYVQNTSTTAFQVQNASGASILNVDTTNSKVGSPDVSAASTNSQALNLATGASSTSGNTGDLTVKTGNAASGNSGNISLDVGTASGTRGTISIGSTNPTAAINIGAVASTSNASTVNIASSNGAANQSINIGNNVPATNTSVVTIGSATANTGSVTTIQGGSNTTSAILLSPNTAGGIMIGAAAGTGTITIGQSTATNTITIGSAISSSNTQTINIGTTSAATSTTNVLVGSSAGGGTTTLQSTGGVKVGTLGAATSTSDAVCRDVSTTLLTTCDTNNNRPFLQGGNSFGAQAVLGTNDSNNVAIETGGSSRAIVDTSGNLTFQQATTIGVVGTTGVTSPYQLTIQAGSATGVPNGANLLLQAGSGTTGTGLVLVKAAAAGGAVFQVQNSVSTALLTVAQGTNPQVKIGAGSTGEATSSLFVLDNQTGSTSDPAEVDGAMYYNAVLAEFRCGKNGFWFSCSVNNIQHSFVFEDEFLGGATTNNAFTATSLTGIGSLGWNVTATTACEVFYNQNGPVISHDHPGNLFLRAGAASGDGCAMTQGGVAPGSPTLNERLAAGDDIKTTAAIDSVARGTMRIGFTNATSGTAPTSGAYFEYDNATDATHWRYCYANNGAATCAATTLTISASTWYQLEIQVVSSTAITFIITPSGGSSETHALTGITYDPGTTNRLGPMFTCYDTTTTTVGCYMDYYQWTGIATTTGGR